MGPEVGVPTFGWSDMISTITPLTVDFHLLRHTAEGVDEKSGRYFQSPQRENQSGSIL